MVYVFPVPAIALVGTSVAVDEDESVPGRHHFLHELSAGPLIDLRVAGLVVEDVVERVALSFVAVGVDGELVIAAVLDLPA